MLSAAALILLSIGAPSGDDPKSPLPDPAAIKQAEATIRNVFKDEYRAKEPAARRAFAMKLHAQALETKDDPAARFVLLRDAADLAAELGDAMLAATAARSIATFYDVKVVDAARPALDKLRKSAMTPETSVALAEACLLLAEEALAAEDPDGAAGVAKDAEAAALKTRHVGLFNKARAAQKEIAEARSQFAAASEARKKLAQSPEDPDACLVVGKQLCFFAGDWAKGLPLLAKGADPALQALAQGDLAEPADAAARVKIGDGWWDAGEKGSGAAKAKLQKRARRWYALALPEVQGLVKAKVEARLQEPWVPIFDGRTLNCIKAACRFGWTVANGAMSKVSTVNESAQTQDEFEDGEFRFRFEVRNLAYMRLSIHQGEQGLDGVQFSGEGLQALEGKPHELVFKARGRDVSATLDGQPMTLSDHSAATKGHLQISVKGEVLRILALEYRPLP